jgi:hypothetical protein
MRGRWAGGWALALCLVAACSSRRGLSPRDGAAGGAGGEAGAAETSDPGVEAGSSTSDAADGVDAPPDVAATGEDAAAVDATDSADRVDAYGFEPGDTPPWRALNVTATAALHFHNVNGKLLGVDGRATPLGKLAVDLGVEGGSYSPWLGKRGYHVLSVAFTQCVGMFDWSQGRDVDDRCHQGEWEMIAAGVKANLTDAAMQFPEEDWGYFLNTDGSVRWSDVVITGMAEGGNTAAFIGRVGARFWRVVSRSAPRADTCGKGPATGPYDPADPPWWPVAPTCDDTHCCLGHIDQWLDAPSLTPLDRFYGIAGMTDGKYGDIMFCMDRAGYPGQPVTFDVPGATLTGTNRFIATKGGSLDWLNAPSNLKPLNTDAVLNIAFAIPPANQNPTF